MQTREQQDEELVLSAQEGDKQAMETLLEKYSNLVRRKARGFFLAGGETEDLIQVGMIGLFNAIKEYKTENKEGASFKTFATHCVNGQLLDAVKSAKRKKNGPLNHYISLFDSEGKVGISNPEDEVIKSEDRREFLQKMSKALSDFEFKVTVMYMDGLSSGEICEATGKDGKSVDNAIQRSKKKLQKVLK